MNKEEFNELEVLNQIEYINTELKNNKSITSVCDELGVGRSTIRDRFKKVNYTYSKELKQYIDDKDIVDVLQSNIKLNNRCDTSVKREENQCSTSITQIETISEIVTKSDEEIRNNLLDIVNNYDVLKDIIELHRHNTSVVKQQIVIDLEDAESKLATLRVNSKVLEQFNEFSNRNKQYKKVDLLSQALKEYMEKY